MNKLWLLLVFAAPVAAGPLSEDRYCGVPARDAQGAIKRRADVIAAFRKAHPCPVTGLTTGACPGWQVDHVISLAACGCDVVSNLQYLPNLLKSGAGALPKDRWERRIYKCPGAAIEITPMPDAQKFRLEAVPR